MNFKQLLILHYKLPLSLNDNFWNGILLILKLIWNNKKTVKQAVLRHVHIVISSYNDVFTLSWNTQGAHIVYSFEFSSEKNKSNRYTDLQK